MKYLFNVVLLLSFVGCMHAPVLPLKPLIEPQFGMTKQQMLDAMGKPESIEMYKKLDDSRYEFDIYIRQYSTSMYKLPICLVNNKVVGWGSNYYQDHIAPEDIRIK